jgi:RNA polymerase sigma-70 factor, ECF subfamily
MSAADNPQLANTDITGLLSAWRAGDKHAEELLMAALYPQLRAQAAQQLRALPAARCLRPTELAHEAYLRLVEQRTPWVNRGHFLAIAARCMRRILGDLLRAQATEKRGDGVQTVSLESLDHDIAAKDESIALGDLLESLNLLERREEAVARVVELRYFGGLSIAETADALDMSVATVGRHWAFARAWLQSQV